MFEVSVGRGTVGCRLSRLFDGSTAAVLELFDIVAGVKPSKPFPFWVVAEVNAGQFMTMAAVAKDMACQ